MIFRYYISLFWMSVIIASCAVFKSKKGLSPKETTAWYFSEAYPLRDTFDINKLKYVFTRVPRNVEAALAIDRGLLTVKEYKAMKKTDDNMFIYMDMYLPRSNDDVFSYVMNDQVNQQKQAEYYSFGLKKDLKLILQSGDSILCNHFQYQKGMANAGRAKFELEFNNVNLNEIKGLQIFDRKTMIKPCLVVFRNVKLEKKRK